MANSIDLGTIILGAAVGYGLRKEIKSTGVIARNALLAGIAGAAATAAAQQDQQDQQGSNNAKKNG